MADQPFTSPTPVSTGRVLFPLTNHSPWWQLSRRMLVALGILVFTVMLVYVDRARLPRQRRPDRTRST